MTMEIEFADGFVSGSSPNLIGLGSESYPILNAQAAFTNFVGLDFSNYTSVIGIYEVERVSDVDGVFRQSGQISFSRRADDSWSITMGSYDGDDLVQLDETLVDTISKIAITMDGEQVQYISGSMDAYQYEGKFKLNLSRVNT